MKGDAQVITYLNKVLTNKLTAINQYFLHCRMFNWGLNKLYDREYADSIDEMKHADKLIARILFLEGLPNLQQLHKLRIGESAIEALRCDRALEGDAHPALKEAIAHCETVGDYVTRELFESILDSEEEHIDWLDTQFTLVDQVGMENYLRVADVMESRPPFALLRSLADGEFHSGEDLAGSFGLSRGAVWYRVRGIEALGVKVFKVRGRGYRLSRPLDLLDTNWLSAELAQSAPRMALSVVDECDSTNAVLSAQADAAHGAVLACEHQRAGRGRRGRRWHSAVGTSLTFSVNWRFAQGAAALSGLAMAVSVAVVDALERMGCSDLKLKWPNDLLSSGAKLGGILVEVRGDLQGPSTAVIGVGLNVDLPEEHRSGIDQPVTDLASLMDAPPRRNAILAAVLSALHEALERYEREGFSSFHGPWSKHDGHRGRGVSLQVGGREIARGTAEGIAEDGALLVRTAEGLKSFYSGEVSLR